MARRVRQEVLEDLRQALFPGSPRNAIHTEAKVVLAAFGLLDNAGALIAGPTELKAKLAGHTAETIGDGATKTFAIAHNLSSTFPRVAVKRVSDGMLLGEGHVEVVVTDANTVTLTFGNAPGEDAMEVKVWA